MVCGFDAGLLFKRILLHWNFSTSFSRACKSYLQFLRQMTIKMRSSPEQDGSGGNQANGLVKELASGYCSLDRQDKSCMGFFGFDLLLSHSRKDWPMVQMPQRRRSSKTLHKPQEKDSFAGIVFMMVAWSVLPTFHLTVLPINLSSMKYNHGFSFTSF